MKIIGPALGGQVFEIDNKAPVSALRRKEELLKPIRASAGKALEDKARRLCGKKGTEFVPADDCPAPDSLDIEIRVYEGLKQMKGFEVVHNKAEFERAVEFAQRPREAVDDANVAEVVYHLAENIDCQRGGFLHHFCFFGAR